MTSKVYFGIIHKVVRQLNMQVWRNWQTRMVQVHMNASSCRFKSCYLHHKIKGTFLYPLFYYYSNYPDLNLKKALSVKQNSMDYCFVAKRCEVGYQMRKHWVDKHGRFYTVKALSCYLHQKGRHPFGCLFFIIYSGLEP